MFANTKFILLTLTAFKVFITSGFVNMTCSTTRPEYEDSETCTCTTDSGTGIEWQKDGTSFLLCYIGGTCDATLPAYDVAYSASGSIKIFSITVKSFMYPDCGSFSCKDQDAVDTETKQLTLYDFNKSVPSVIQEPGTKESGKIEITTDCLFKDSNEVVVLWYTVKEGEQPKEYFPDEKYITSTNCSDAAKTCSGEKAVILNIGFVHTEKTRECVQFRLEVYHILNATEKLELTTSSQYCIKVGWKWWEIFLIVVGILYGLGLIIGFIKWLLQSKKSCEEFCEKYCDVPGKKDDVWKLCFIIFLCIIIVGLGFMTVWLIRRYCCSGGGNGDVKPKEEKPRHETRSGNTRTGQKKPETKKNESKDSVAHIENEQHNQGRKHREQPPPPSDAGAGTTLHGREDSDGAVSREHVDLQESGRTLPQRPMPGIPRKNDGQGHDSKGRGLSANFNDDDHPLIGIDIPSKRAGALGSLSEGTGGEGPVKKLKKKKRKSKEDQEDEV